MPINKSYPIEVLIKAISDYIDETNRRVTIEYILLQDINDTEACANMLADLLHGLNVYVNFFNVPKRSTTSHSSGSLLH